MHALFAAHLAALLPGLARPMVFGRVLRHVEWFLAKRARNRTFVVLIVFLLTVAIRTALLPLAPPGVPVVHDEYSYLLQADTFASGRLANPPHPLWEHFETFHVLQQPTYASKFFPGQAAFLALGQVALGHPWWGVALSVGLMCAAMTWCLLGFLSPGWAFFGGLATVLQYGTTHYFATSYWGGAVPAMGGCLALGAVARLLREPRPKDGIWLGLGVATLAATRPYEGGILCAGLGVWLLLDALRHGRLRLLAGRALLPAGAVLAVGAGALLFSFKAVTGDPFYPPYVAYNDQYYYGQGMAFTENRPLTAPLRHEPMQRYLDTWALPTLRQGSTWQGMAASLPMRLEVFDKLLNPVYYAPMLLAPLAVVRLRRLRPLAALFALAVVASFGVAWSLPHYFAPALGVFVALWLGVLRWLRCVTVAGRPVGLSLVRLLPLILVVSTGVATYRYADRPISNTESQARIRRDLETKLLQTPGRHLVVVQYLPDSNVHAEWVYNAADIDNAPVVWARDMGREKNEALRAYFKDRTVWCATVGGNRIDFGPCGGGEPADATSGK